MAASEVSLELNTEGLALGGGICLALLLVKDGNRVKESCQRDMKASRQKGKRSP